MFCMFLFLAFLLALTSVLLSWPAMTQSWIYIPCLGDVSRRYSGVMEILHHFTSQSAFCALNFSLLETSVLEENKSLHIKLCWDAFRHINSYLPYVGFSISQQDSFRSSLNVSVWLILYQTLGFQKMITSEKSCIFCTISLFGHTVGDLKKKRNL